MYLTLLILFVRLVLILPPNFEQSALIVAADTELTNRAGFSNFPRICAEFNQDTAFQAEFIIFMETPLENGRVPFIFQNQSPCQVLFRVF